MTPRELETFWLVADRLANREIAEQLHVAERTVESHVSSLLRKLGGTTRMSLIRRAGQIRAGMRAKARDLPQPLSSFVGRTAQLDELRRLVGVHRIVTLTGPAGAGKTRLALQLARSAAGMPDAVLVDLALLPRADAVDRAFADALGVEGDGRALRTGLRRALADGRHWLLVDNCEHISAAVAALLAELLSATAGLRVLATSHGPLRVAGEVVYEVPPLDLPPEVDDPSAAAGASAVRLFVDRAVAASPGFALSVNNIGDVATVCRLLDGLPLAIELAAARVRVFSPAELVSRLDDRFALLTDGPQGPPNRHRTLEEALRWSYELLHDGERLLLERCSVFPGGFDYATAAGVLGYPPLGPAELARLFPRLVDRSLLVAGRHGQNTEYRLLDSVRQFAARRLGDREGADRVRAAHARYHLRHAVTLVADLRGADQLAALAWFDRRYADLVAGLGWAAEHGERELAWEFLAGVGTGWDIVGPRGELFDWLDVLLEGPLPSGSRGIHAAVATATMLSFRDIKRARAFAESAHDQALGGSEHELNLARLALGLTGRYDQGGPAALDSLAQAAEGFRRAGDHWHHALALLNAGTILLVDGQIETGFKHLAGSAELFGRIQDQVQLANVRNHMALQAIRTGSRLDEVDGWLTQARQLAAQTGNRQEWLHAEVFQACLDQSRGAHAAAANRFGELLGELRRKGDRRCEIRCLQGLGRAALHEGDQELARGYLTEAAGIAANLGEEPTTAQILRLLAEIESPGFGR